MRDVVWSISWPDYEHKYLSPSLEKLYGRQAQEFYNNPNLFKEVTHLEDMHLMEKAIEQLLEKGEAVRQCRIVRPLGSIVWVEDKSKMIYDEDGQPIKVDGLTQDITELKGQEEKLNKALMKKDQLMQELNHRVKNNLHMVSSLISLKESENGNNLSDLRHQIDAISLIHEKLYQTGKVAEVCLRDCIDDLLASIFSFTMQRVRIDKSIEDVSVPTKTAVSLGLIVNEIATNAIKHGFNEKEEAVFTVKLETDKENTQCVLILSNTGNPFPDDIDFESSNTLGLRLVTALVAQIDGTLELNKKLTRFLPLVFLYNRNKPKEIGIHSILT